MLWRVIGDVVNLASRIEQLNKQVGSQFLISETVWKAALDSLTGALPMGAVQVKRTTGADSDLSSGLKSRSGASQMPFRICFD